MTAVPIAFQSSEGEYSFEGVTQLINCYAERRGADSKAPLSVLPSHGIVELCDTTVGPCRGMIFMEDLDTLYSVHPSSCYKITYDGTTATALRVGTVPGIDSVQLSRNQKADPEITVQASSGVQFLTSDSLSYSTDVDFPSDVVTAEYVGGYSAYGLTDRRFFISSINDSKVIDPLDFATFEQKAGKLIKIVENAGEMIGLCSSWMEFWRDTGNATFPLQPIAFRTRGLKAANAVMRCDNTIMFPGDDGVVYRLNNYDPMRISTHSIERLISSDSAAEDMIGFSWTRDGHAFANLTGTDWSRCYDAATGVWHSRQSYGYDTWRGKYTAAAWNKIIIGDSLSGKLGYLDRETYTEFGDPIIWGVDSPTLHAFPDGGIVDALYLDVATGYGTLSGQGSNPKIMLQVSKDGGATFGQYQELELGIQGKYATRVIARRLGKFGPKGIIFRLRISDPVARALVGTSLRVKKLTM